MLRYLDQHAPQICSVQPIPEIKPEKKGFLSKVFGGGLSSQEEARKKLEQEYRQSIDEIDFFLKELARLEWLPVLMDAPFVGLPWNSTEGKQLVARCSDVRPIKDAWLVVIHFVHTTEILKKKLQSGFMCLLDFEDLRSPELTRAFGWDLHPPATMTAAQLVCLSREKVPESEDARREYAANISSHISKFYSCFASLPTTDFEVSPPISSPCFHRSHFDPGGESYSLRP